MLQNLLHRADNLSTNRQPNKIAKREVENGYPLKHCLFMALTSQWKLANSNPAIDKSKIEIEIRIGMLIRNECRWQAQSSSGTAMIFDDDSRSQQKLEFRAGIDRIFLFQHLHKHILTEQNGFKQVAKSVQHIRSNSSSLRWEVVPISEPSSSSSSIKLCETKERFFRWNLGLLSHEYDIRIDGAVERQVDDESAGRMLREMDWLQERIKHRTSYTTKRHPHWRIDVTEVHTSKRQGSGVRPTCIDYELEFELDASYACIWLSLAIEAEADMVATRLSESLEGLINACIPSEEVLSNAVSMESISSNDIKREIKKMNDMLMGAREMTSSSSSSFFDFLGAMPSNMSRHSLELVRQRDYLITEKSDGVRYLMYVVNDTPSSSMAVFVDRAKEVYHISGSHAIGKIFQVGTILDCEIVYNKTYNAQMILIFDVLAVDGRTMINSLFLERLAALDGIINQRIAEYIRFVQSTPTIGNVVKYVTRKKYLPKLDIASLLAKIHFENGHRVYHEPDGRRHHKTDGIIFQPADRPYQFFSDSNLLKWKWPDLRTVDLIASHQIINPTSSSSSTAALMDDSYPFISLSCSGPDDVMIDCTKRGGSYISVSRFDSYRMLADITAPHLPYGKKPIRIVEVMYDASLGQWKYFRFRQDKSKPNYIDTVMSVFIEQAEDISVEELEYTLIVSDQRPAFRVLVQDKMRRLVDDVRIDNKRKSTRPLQP